MHPFPHTYQASASAQPTTTVAVASPGLPGLNTDAPAEFDGPGDLWSPETLLTAAVADCFVLTFRGIAKASRLEWNALDCYAEGTLDRVERVTRFSAFRIVAELRLPRGSDAEQAEKLLHKAERSCLITNSFVAETTLETRVVVDAG
ncbi:MAG: OsmC family protein [Caldilineaceae bacterium]|nr:OsmC family protein [Caldilineaceae bacterium]